MANKQDVEEYPDVVTFRAHQDLKGDLAELIKWCKENNSCLQAVLNSFLPAISVAVTHFTFRDPETGKLYIRADFGDIFLRPNHYTQRNDE